MPNSHPKPILNTSLPAQFRQIHIELAREPDHPEGDAGIAYVIIAPLDANDRIDPTLGREHREACRITRLRPNEEARRTDGVLDIYRDGQRVFPNLREIRGEHKQHRHLRGKGFGRSNADLRPRMGIENAVRLARDG